MTMKNIEHIQNSVLKLGEKIQAPIMLLSVATQPLGDGSYHLEIANNEYHYISTERGKVIDKKVTTKTDELLFWILLDVTMNMAISYEIANHRDDRDHRRLIFDQKIKLLEKLSHDWSKIEQLAIEEILREYPFDDDLNKRVQLCKKMSGEGYSADEAYEKACETYPEN